ncbi:CoA pyrophosphatase [Alsobacter sp. SYSU M60028]|uniref:CoA pyrophosphatase n=1 Tax=Alsobacter ponti TaxID=2962936 RepID=A0ABT1L7M4_9HYPH|nr:CoA pyrophosphatase [Alsobacter ponti]MCP8937003.1 CoA pyrophosphatase [Alsobacter ponti]
MSSTVLGDAFSPEAFEARALARLSLAEPEAPADPAHVPARGDHVLNPDDDPASRHAERPPRPAAVLIPVVARPSEATVLLTRRASHLRDHSGQVAFPGGKIDEADGSAVMAALREAEEEIGLDRRFVRPLACLDLYLTGTGFRIVPVIGLVSPGFTLAVNADEVDEAFEVPLAFLMTPDNHERRSREWRGRQRHFYAMPYGDHLIWGVTAGIVRNMYERLFAT